MPKSENIFGPDVKMLNRPTKMRVPRYLGTRIFHYFLLLSVWDGTSTSDCTDMRVPNARRLLGAPPVNSYTVSKNIDFVLSDIFYSIKYIVQF